MNKVNISIAGLGNVGSALVQLIEKFEHQSKDKIARESSNSSRVDTF